jgi:hypothetical protein
MNPNISILLIDDEPDYCRSLQELALLEYNIIITYYHNHDEGFAALAKDNSYHGLILDAKCLINPQQEFETDEALAYALNKLADYEQKYNRFLPFVVNTGYSDFTRFFSKSLEERQSRIFLKSQPAQEMLEYLLAQVNNSEIFQIERAYADVLTPFNKGYLPSEQRNNLMNIIKNMQRQEPAEISKTLTLIRVVNEKLMDALGKATAYKFTQPDLIVQLSSHLIRKIGSNYGAHPSRTTDIQPSSYTVCSLSFALFETLLWFTAEMDKVKR